VALLVTGEGVLGLVPVRVLSADRGGIDASQDILLHIAEEQTSLLLLAECLSKLGLLKYSSNGRNEISPRENNCCSRTERSSKGFVQVVSLVTAW
jgi:hypothetical protein